VQREKTVCGLVLNCAAWHTELAELAALMERQHETLMDLAHAVEAMATGLEAWRTQAAVSKVLQERQIAAATQFHLLPTLWTMAASAVVHHRALLLMRDVAGPTCVIITPSQVHDAVMATRTGLQ
jgi:hypothetical protein